MPVTLPLKPRGFFHPDIQHLVASLVDIQQCLSANEEDISYIRHFLRSRDFQISLRVSASCKHRKALREWETNIVYNHLRECISKVLQAACKYIGNENQFLGRLILCVTLGSSKVFNKVSSYASMRIGASTDSAVSTGVSVYNTLRKHKQKTNVEELREIMSKPHFQALLYTHDKVASGDYEPHIFSVPQEVDEDEAAVKIVRIIKNEEPLGATIQRNEITNTLEIARILHGGAADRSGLVHVGDHICEVNGTNIQNYDPKEVVQLLARLAGPVTLKLIPAENDKGLVKESKICFRFSQMRVRALFDYDPQEDSLIPCPEAGLPFQKGDILHIVSQEDPLWWQARKEGDRIMRAGLIPGKQLQERKEILGRPLSSDCRNSDSAPRIKSSSGSLSPCRFSPKIPKSKKLKKTMYHVTQNQAYDSEEIITYEEVEYYYPKPDFPRPVTIVGPHGIGRNELKRRLMASKPNHFQEVIPYTSRPKKPHELDGRDYHFVSREEMEKGILMHKFVEYGEYKGNLYGSSIDSIKCVINSGKVCVLTPHTQALKFLRTADIKPFIVFIKTPSFDILKSTRLEKNAKHTVDDIPRPFTDEEMQQMITTSKKMEIRYGHFFDWILINEHLEQAIAELIQIANRLETEPQWVPANWVQ